MKKYKKGFSLQHAIFTLAVVLLIATAFPIVIDSVSENKKESQLSNSSECVFKNLVKSYQDSNAAYAYYTEPIVLDLNGDGIKITNLNNGIFFDFNGDGFAEKMSWIDDKDGILAVDLNKNGKIDNGNEILTFKTLNSYDTNRDGIINAKDKNFNKLKVLKRDGKILSLEEAGITSINTSITPENYIDEFGNYKFGEGTFTTTNGKVFRFDEYYFVTDFTNSQELNVLKETKEIAKLPDIKGRGTVRSLHQAMIRDAELQKLVEKFIKEQNESQKTELLNKILAKWTGSEKTAIDSRGKNVNARHLAVVEAFIGCEFGSTENGSGVKKVNPNGSNPDPLAGEMLETIYLKLENYVYAELMSQTQLIDLVKLMKYDNNSGKYDLTPVVIKLDKEVKANPQAGKQRVLEFAKMIKGLEIDKNSNFFDAKNEECFYLKFTNDDRELKWQIDSIAKVPLIIEKAKILDGEVKGTAGDDAYRAEKDKSASITIHTQRGADVLYGSSERDVFVGCAGEDLLDGGDGDDKLVSNEDNDIIFGGGGNDEIYAGQGDDIIFGGDGDDKIYPDHYDIMEQSYAEDGNDIIIGGKGNDTIYSMVGDDTYIFYPGDGQDTIYEKQGTDTLYFGKGIKWTDLIFEKSGEDMIIKIKKSNDKITVKDWFAKGQNGKINNKIEIFEFSDGSKHYEKEIIVK